MKSVKFKEQNHVIAKKQPPYKQLPCFVDKGSDERIVVSCYKMSWKEKIVFLFTGKIYLSVMTFGEPLQPQKLEVIKSRVFKMGK